MPDNLTFNAELKQVSSKKLVSLDIEYKVVLTTLDPKVLSLGALDADEILTVEVSVDG